MHQTTIHFPDLRLSPRDGHKLRGYFSRLFGAASDLWHNHESDGRPIYRYPLIQYKVVDRQPMLIGVGAGAQLLVEHFLEVRELEIDGLRLPVHSKQVKSRKVEVGVNGNLHRYRFANPWFAFNQHNYQEYQDKPVQERQPFLERLLTGHILAFYKGVEHWEEEKILVNLLEVHPLMAKFKNQPMLMFRGQFVTNARLPEYIGLGKSVSRGFGTVCAAAAGANLSGFPGKGP
ncbi:MAG: CRISPR-associated endonuclease Cas6 [Phaeodactylibacter sp.]|uniref:CRISPR-associated endonuclease Cas6 n=1 Tax=Phaeodactylibacter sp. TaxID=1940289 RepID=UPI0032EB5000